MLGPGAVPELEPGETMFDPAANKSWLRLWLPRLVHAVAALVLAAVGATAAAQAVERPWFIPETRDPRLTAAAVRYAMDGAPPALAQFDALRSADPPLDAADAMRLRYLRALALLEIGHIEHATSEVREALQSAFRIDSAETPLVQVLASRIAMRSGRWMQAFTESSAALALAIKNDKTFRPLVAHAVTLRQAASAYAGVSNFGGDEAMDWLIGAVIGAPSDPLRPAVLAEPWASLAIDAARVDAERHLRRDRLASAQRMLRAAAEIERRAIRASKTGHAQTLRRLRLASPWHGLDMTLQVLASVALVEGSADEAQSALGEALPLAIESGGIGRAKHVLRGSLHPALQRRRCRVPDVLPVLRAPSLAANDARALRSLLFNEVGLCWLQFGADPAQGETSLRSALSLERDVEPAVPGELATRHQNLGLALLHLRRHDEALVEHRQALVLRRAARDPLASQSATSVAAALVVSGRARELAELRDEAVQALLAVSADTAFHRLRPAEFAGGFCVLAGVADLAIEPAPTGLERLREQARTLCPARAVPPASAASSASAAAR
jgi:tetratricopeptide (TPR) repeat protein